MNNVTIQNPNPHNLYNPSSSNLPFFFSSFYLQSLPKTKKTWNLKTTKYCLYSYSGASFSSTLRRPFACRAIEVNQNCLHPIPPLNYSHHLLLSPLLYHSHRLLILLQVLPQSHQRKHLIHLQSLHLRSQNFQKFKFHYQQVL